MSSSTQKTKTFENEILGLQPHCDLIFGKKLDDHETHFIREEKETIHGKMKFITTMNKILGNKRIGDLPSEIEWEKNIDHESETIAMIRNMGSGPKRDYVPQASRTISTFPTKEGVVFNYNGKKVLPIFFSEKYFQFKSSLTGRPYSSTMFNEQSKSSDSKESPRAPSTQHDQNASEVDGTERLSPDSNAHRLKNHLATVDCSGMGKQTTSANEKSVDTENKAHSSSHIPLQHESPSLNVRDTKQEEEDRKQEPTKPTTKLSKKENPPINPSPRISCCGTLLYTPKEMTLKRRAELIKEAVKFQEL